jgi:hypothetical protein
VSQSAIGDSPIDRAQTLQGLSERFSDAGLTVEALHLVEQAVGIKRKLMIDHPDTDSTDLIGALELNIELLVASNRSQEAHHLSRELEQIRAAASQQLKQA